MMPELKKEHDLLLVTCKLDPLLTLQQAKDKFQKLMQDLNGIIHCFTTSGMAD
jgi:hypothetical protein